MKKIIALLTIILLSVGAFSQNLTFGPKIMGNLSLPKTLDEVKTKQGGLIKDGSTKLYDYTESIKYDTKTSFGVSLFLQSDIKLNDNWGIIAGFGIFDYYQFKINQTIDRVQNNYNLADTSLINTVTSTQKLEATYKYTFLTLEAMLKYSFDKLNIFIGPSFMFNINSKIKTSSEYDDGKYLTPVVNLKVGLNYDLELSENMIIAPEVNFAYPLSNIREDDYFKAKLMNLGIGVALKYNL